MTNDYLFIVRVHRAVPRQQSNLSSVCVLLSEQSVAFVNKAGLRERVPLEEVRLPEMAAYYRSLADVKNVHMTGEYNVASLSDFGKVIETVNRYAFTSTSAQLVPGLTVSICLFICLSIFCLSDR